MATTSADVTCPVCEDYEGPQRSVEAHISASGGEHKGHVGKEHRMELEEQVAVAEVEDLSGEAEEAEQEEVERDDVDADVEVEETEREPPRPSADGAPRSEDTAIDGETAGAAAATAAAGLPLLFSEEGPSTETVLVGVGVALVVGWLLLRDGSGEATESPSTGEPEETQAESEATPTGVIGGLNE